MIRSANFTAFMKDPKSALRSCLEYRWTHRDHAFSKSALPCLNISQYIIEPADSKKLRQSLLKGGKVCAEVLKL